MRKLLLLAMVLLAALTQTSYAQSGSASRKELPSTRVASPSTSSATFAIGMSKDGNQSFVETAATTDNIGISGVIRPESGHVGQAGNLYLVVMVTPGQFIMRNQQGAFVSWNGDIATLTPYSKVNALPAQQSVDIFSGVLGAAGQFHLFIAYSAADNVLHYTAQPLTIKFIVDFDKDGIADNEDADDDNDKVNDNVDLFPQNPARTMAIAPAFPKANGIFQFPDYPSTRQVNWILEQLAASSTSLEDINAHFTANALSKTPATQIQALLQTVRTASPKAIVIDPVTVSPTYFRTVIGTAGTPTSGRFLSVTTKYAGGLIDALSITNYPLNGAATTQENINLSMTQAVQKLVNVSPNGSSVLVARIQNNQCVPIQQHAATTQRSTGSIFKEWVLGALGQALNDGVIAVDAKVPLIASEIVNAGSSLNTEPLGTVFPLADMAAAMMGISDNTATDHLHELVGRSRLEAIVKQFNHSKPESLTPFLSLNEQFNLFTLPALSDARAYRDGTEQYRRNVLTNVLTPLGPWKGGGIHQEMMINGAWQASPMDVCAAMAGMRQFNDLSPGLKLVDQAFGAEVVFPFVRNRWERVWFKGGSLATVEGLKVITYSWLLESDSKGTFVVVSMHNDLSHPNLATAGIDWTMARILQLVGDGTFQ
jgi:hypothetical protein